jgi:hypothetical protein
VHLARYSGRGGGVGMSQALHLMETILAARPNG